MGMTITEKILAKASGNSVVKAGDIVEANIDVAMAHDGLGPIVFDAMRELGREIWDLDKVVVVIDHSAPPSALMHADLVRNTLDFVRDYNVKHLYNMQGVAHQLLPENGFVSPAGVIVGTDSHTCTYGGLGAFSTGIGSTEMAAVFSTGKLWFRVPETIKVNVTGKLQEHVMAKDIILKTLSILGADGATYKALEFTGNCIEDLSVDGRLTLCNMAVETGAKNGIVACDEKTVEYLKGRVSTPYEPLYSDADAEYCQVIEIDANELAPQVACPHSPANVVDVDKVAGKVVDQVLIGTCTDGRMEDFRVAAAFLKGKKIPNHIRCLILPASNEIYRKLMEEGLIEIFLDAGCVILNANCGPCGGMHEGLIAKGEVCLGTHNRNFKGRMGNPEGEIYLSSPAVAAVSAIAGQIVNPQNERSVI